MYYMITLPPINVCSYTILTYFASHIGLILIHCITAFTLRVCHLHDTSISRVAYARVQPLCGLQLYPFSVNLYGNLLRNPYPSCIHIFFPFVHCTNFVLAKALERVTYKYEYISKNCKFTVLDNSRKQFTLF